MAKKTFVRLVDDISGDNIAEGEGRTVSFSIDGANYEIDLSTAHIAELKETLDPYLRAGRRAAAGTTRRATGTPASRGKAHAEELQAIREWANSNGHTVSTRGRIAQSVIDAYNNR